jgi:hypothetical protein
MPDAPAELREHDELHHSRQCITKLIIQLIANVVEELWHACFAGKVLYEKVAELCPRHPGRSEKAKREAQAKHQGVASSSAAASSKQSGKSGKKKRK